MVAGLSLDGNSNFLSTQNETSRVEVVEEVEIKEEVTQKNGFKH